MFLPPSICLQHALSAFAFPLSSQGGSIFRRATGFSPSRGRAGQGRFSGSSISGYDLTSEGRSVSRELTSVADELRRSGRTSAQKPAPHNVQLEASSLDDSTLHLRQSCEPIQEVLPVREVVLNNTGSIGWSAGPVGSEYFGPHKKMREMSDRYRDEYSQKIAPMQKRGDPVSFPFCQDGTSLFDHSNTLHIGTIDMQRNEPIEWIAVNPLTGQPPNSLYFNTMAAAADSKSAPPCRAGPQGIAKCGWFCCPPIPSKSCSPMISRNDGTVTNDVHSKNISTTNNRSWNGYYPENIQYSTKGPLLVTAHTPLPVKANPDDVRFTMYRLNSQNSLNDRETESDWFIQQRNAAIKNADAIISAQKRSVWFTAPSPFAVSKV